MHVKLTLEQVSALHIVPQSSFQSPAADFTVGSEQPTSHERATWPGPLCFTHLSPGSDIAILPLDYAVLLNVVFLTNPEGTHLFII